MQYIIAIYFVSNLLYYAPYCCKFNSAIYYYQNLKYLFKKRKISLIYFMQYIYIFYLLLICYIIEHIVLHA